MNQHLDWMALVLPTESDTNEILWNRIVTNNTLLWDVVFFSPFLDSMAPFMAAQLETLQQTLSYIIISLLTIQYTEKEFTIGH